MFDVPDDFLTPEDAAYGLQRMQYEIDKAEYLADHMEDDSE